ncbi:MAG: MoxR family ATPase [Euryarchaeota archaeon]|nr:MoxR family ATPase [Euryarchaeota archaeon]
MTETQVQNPRVVFDGVLERIGGSFVGDPTLLRKVLAAALANGHVLFEDYPGLGKTLLVKVVSRVLGADARRVQFTPDILPADITGTKVWDTDEGRFRLEKGPVFTNVLLADEINRAPPKTQSALLEAMEERQVTIEGDTHILPPPFFVLATQNPIEQEGTYPLPEAQMDRFLMKLSTGYPPNLAAEREILKRRIAWQKEDPTADIQPAMDIESFRKYQMLCETRIFVHDDVLDYISTLVRELRSHPRLEIGPSPRGALALLRASRALALLHGRDFVTPDDVRMIAIDCLAHRSIVEMEQALEGFRSEDAVADVLNKVRPPFRFKRGA